MRLFLLLAWILLPVIAYAHDDQQLCRGMLFDRDPLWVIEHDAWWSCNVAFHAQQVEYGRCLGAVRELEARLSKKRRKGYQAFIENPGVLSYTFPQHPTEDRFNNVEASHAEVEACDNQLAAHILPEVLRCSAHLQRLRMMK